jgi:DNA-binding SARP family transcriptional activator
MYQGRFLPGASLSKDGTPVVGPAVQRHPLALLAVLAAHASSEVSRDTACMLLWPERDERAARHLLSEALYALRRALGRGAIPGSGPSLRLDHARVWTDVAVVSRAASAGEPEVVVELYRGPFLDGFHLAGSPDFEAWQHDRRRYFESLFADSLYAVADRAEATGNHLAAAHWLRLRVDQDPLSSHATHRLMLALARMGDRAAAILIAREHARALQVELGIPAAPCVRDLEALLAGPDAVDLDRIPKCGTPGSGCAPEVPPYPGGP